MPSDHPSAGSGASRIMARYPRFTAILEKRIRRGDYAIGLKHKGGVKKTTAGKRG